MCVRARAEPICRDVYVRVCYTCSKWAYLDRYIHVDEYMGARILLYCIIFSWWAKRNNAAAAANLIQISANKLINRSTIFAFGRNRTGFDKSSLERLEQLFRKTVGNEKEIRREDFKKIVTSKNVSIMFML